MNQTRVYRAAPADTVRLRLDLVVARSAVERVLAPTSPLGFGRGGVVRGDVDLCPGASAGSRPV